MQNQTRRAGILKLSMALWGIGILGVTLSDRASAQVTAPETATLPATPPVVVNPATPDPGTAPAVASAETTPVLVIADNELRLDGTVAAVNAAQNSLTLDVSSFTLPSGKTQALAAPRPKIIVLTPNTWLHPVNDAAQKVALADVAMGAALVVIGKDAGTGRALTAREIGTEPTAIPPTGDANGGAGGDVPEAPDIVALRQALTIRITQLQAELQQLKTNPDAYNKTQINELIASLRGEFAVNLQNLSKRVTALEVAAHRGGPATAVTPLPAPPGAPAPASPVAPPQ